VNTHELVLPLDFQDYAWEVESKGWFDGAVLFHLNNRYRLTFYDSVRLGQEIGEELRRQPLFIEPNLLVVESVTEAAMRKAVDYAVAAGLVRNLVAE
jgi:hypothetical protein